MLFGEFGVKVVSGSRFLGGYVSGSRFLGGYIGEDHGRKEYVKMKVQSWVDSVYCLSDAAKQQPQAAYAALVKSIQCEWIFLQRVVVNSSELFSALKDAIREVFWPFVWECSL